MWLIYNQQISHLMRNKSISHISNLHNIVQKIIVQQYVVIFVYICSNLTKQTQKNNVTDG